MELRSAANPVSIQTLLVRELYLDLIELVRSSGLIANAWRGGRCQNENGHGVRVRVAEIAQRIYRRLIDVHFVVEVRAGRTAAPAFVPDDIAKSHAGPRLSGKM